MHNEFIRIVHETGLENPLGTKQVTQVVGKPYTPVPREINPLDTGAKLGAETLMQLMNANNEQAPVHHEAAQKGYPIAPKE